VIRRYPPRGTRSPTRHNVAYGRDENAAQKTVAVGTPLGNSSVRTGGGLCLLARGFGMVGGGLTTAWSSEAAASVAWSIAAISASTLEKDASW
jgi:hypothetical protein